MPTHDPQLSSPPPRIRPVVQPGTRRLNVRAAGADGNRHIGSADLLETVAEALESVLRDGRGPLSGDAGYLPDPQARRAMRARQAARIKACFRRHRGNPLVRGGVVVDRGS